MSLSGSFTWVSRALPSGAGWKAIREFFAYHGVWAIGVRGMRQKKPVLAGKPVLGENS